MKSDFYAAIAQIASERSLSKDVIIESVEQALISAYKRMMGTDQNVSVNIDPTTGMARVYSEKLVVEEVTDPRIELSLAEARAVDPQAEVGS
jgi:N utilization substance protein A